MPVNAERIARLEELGLTPYQARAYLALLDLGEGMAKDVAALARVPKAKVYGALDGLAARGLAEVRPTRPRRFAPLPIADYVDALARDARRRADALEAEAPRLAEAFHATGEADATPRRGFAVLRGRRNVHARLLDLFADARERVVVRASAGFAERVARGAGDALRDVRNAGVRVLLAAPAEAVDGPLPGEGEPGVTRVTADAPGNGDVSLVVIDGRVALVARSTPDDAHLHHGDDVALLTRDAALAAAFESLVLARARAPEELFYRTRA